MRVDELLGGVSSVERNKNGRQSKTYDRHQIKRESCHERTSEEEESAENPRYPCPSRQDEDYQSEMLKQPKIHEIMADTTWKQLRQQRMRWPRIKRDYSGPGGKNKKRTLKTKSWEYHLFYKKNVSNFLVFYTFFVYKHFLSNL